MKLRWHKISTPKKLASDCKSTMCCYLFSCDLCGADYVDYTARHLHQCIAEHKKSVIGKRLLEAHGDTNLLNNSQFQILRKWRNNPSLNMQTVSIHTKLFVFAELTADRLAQLVEHQTAVREVARSTSTRPTLRVFK